MFFILPLWFLCLVLSVLLLFFKKYRFLAPYVALCSTGTFAGCLVFGILVLFGITKVENPNSSALGFVFLIALVVAALLGACVGLGILHGEVVQSSGWVETFSTA